MHDRKGLRKVANEISKRVVKNEVLSRDSIVRLQRSCSGTIETPTSEPFFTTLLVEREGQAVLSSLFDPDDSPSPAVS